MTDPQPFDEKEIAFFRQYPGYQTCDARRAIATIDKARRGDMARLKEVTRETIRVIKRDRDNAIAELDGVDGIREDNEALRAEKTRLSTIIYEDRNLNRKRDDEAYDVEARLSAHLPGAPGTPAERVGELAEQLRTLRDLYCDALAGAVNQRGAGAETQGLNPGVEPVSNPDEFDGRRYDSSGGTEIVHPSPEQPSPSTPDEWMDEWSRRASALFGYGYVASVDDRPDEFKLGEKLIVDVIASTLAGVAKTETAGCTNCEDFRESRDGMLEKLGEAHERTAKYGWDDEFGHWTDALECVRSERDKLKADLGKLRSTHAAACSRGNKLQAENESLRERLVTAEALFAGATEDNEALSAKLAEVTGAAKRLHEETDRLCEQLLDDEGRKLPHVRRALDAMTDAVVDHSPAEALRARDEKRAQDLTAKFLVFLADLRKRDNAVAHLLKYINRGMWPELGSVEVTPFGFHPLPPSTPPPDDDSLGTCEPGLFAATALSAQEPKDDSLFDAVAEADLAKVAHALCGKPWHGVDGEWLSPIPCTQPVDHKGDCYRYATDEEG